MSMSVTQLEKKWDAIAVHQLRAEVVRLHEALESSRSEVDQLQRALDCSQADADTWWELANALRLEDARAVAINQSGELVIFGDSHEQQNSN